MLHACECFLNTLLTRASVRWFKPDPIPKSIVEKLIEAATRAPTASAGEQWYFIVIESEDKRKVIHALLKKAHEVYARKVLRKPLPEHSIAKWMTRIDEGMYYAPLYIAAYIDLRRRLYSDEYSEYEKLMAVQSLSAAIENLILTAWSMGIGAVWLGVPLLLKSEFDKVLNPPEGLELQAVIAIGYPAEALAPRKRRPLSEVYHVV